MFRLFLHLNIWIWSILLISLIDTCPPFFLVKVTTHTHTHTDLHSYGTYYPGNNTPVELRLHHKPTSCNNTAFGYMDGICILAPSWCNPDRCVAVTLSRSLCVCMCGSISGLWETLAFIRLASGQVNGVYGGAVSFSVWCARVCLWVFVCARR